MDCEHHWHVEDRHYGYNPFYLRQLTEICCHCGERKIQVFNPPDPKFGQNVYKRDESKCGQYRPLPEQMLWHNSQPPMETYDTVPVTSYILQFDDKIIREIK